MEKINKSDKLAIESFLNENKDLIDKGNFTALLSYEKMRRFNPALCRLFYDLLVDSGIDLADEIDYIPYGYFYDYSGNVIIKKNIKSIDPFAFSGCNIDELYLENFDDCTFFEHCFYLAAINRVYIITSNADDEYIWKKLAISDWRGASTNYFVNGEELDLYGE